MALSSLLTTLFVPPLHLLVTLWLIAAGLFLLHKRKRAVILCAVSLAWVLLWSLPITTLWAGGRLEHRYAYQPPATLPLADVIVVLGGDTLAGQHNWFEPYELDKVHRRTDMAAQVYRAHRAPIIIASGAASDDTVPEAELMARRLISQGVDAHAILIEPRGATTYQSTRQTHQMMQQNNLETALLEPLPFTCPEPWLPLTRQALRAYPPRSNHKSPYRKTLNSLFGSPICKHSMPAAPLLKNILPFWCTGYVTGSDDSTMVWYKRSY